MGTPRRRRWGLLAGIVAGAAAAPGPPSPAPTVAPGVVAVVARARLATAKYATDVESAKADGDTIITPMIPNMGYHFLNPAVQDFDVTKRPILVYVRQGGAVAARRPRGGVPDVTRPRSVAGGALWSVGRGLPLHGRHLRPGGGPGTVRQDESRDGRRVHFLAPAARHAAPVDLVPQSRRGVRRVQSVAHAIQRVASAEGTPAGPPPRPSA